jgi:hypothetical protein
MVDLPDPDRPVNQRITGFWAFNARPCGFVDSELLYVDIGGAAQREGDHPGRQRGIAEAVDEDECAGRPVALVGIDRYGHARREIAEADLVQGQRLGRELACVLTSSRCLMSVTAAGRLRWWIQAMC